MDRWAALRGWHGGRSWSWNYAGPGSGAIGLSSSVTSGRDRQDVHRHAELLEQPGERAIQGQVARHVAGVPGVKRLGDGVDRRGREAERLGHLAHRGSRAVGDHVADHGRVVGAVPAVDVLDHLLATVDVEVDVDVGKGARLVDEALEEELVLDGIDLGDAQGVGHDRVTGAPPPLADDVFRSRVFHQVPDDQEELGQVGAVDDSQLVR